MVKEKQLTLFNLSPMDEGKEKINLSGRRADGAPNKELQGYS